MSNTKISELPEFTGDTTGAYLIMNNSGQTTSYKVEKETLFNNVSHFNLGQSLVLPSGNLGDMVVSGSNLYFYNGSDWMEMNGNVISTMTPTPEPDYSITSTPTISPTPTPTGLPENEQIVFTIDPDPGSDIYTSLGASQSFQLNITSILPSSGVTIDVNTKKDSDNTIVSLSTIISNDNNNSITVNNLLAGVLCTTTITVTSRNGGDNSATKTFKIARM
jgi:hypothetical protein